MKTLFSSGQPVVSRSGKVHSKMQSSAEKMAAAFFASAIAFTSGALADDTEIFFTQNSGAANVLFVLDTSGSMSLTDGGTQSRLQIMQGALDNLLDRISGVNVGMMSFTSRASMGLHQPVRPITDAHKADMKASINGLVDGGGTPTLRAMWNGTQYYRGEFSQNGNGQVFDSPISHECQENHIVLLTDGSPTEDSETQDVVEDSISGNSNFQCSQVDVGSRDDNGTCGVELAEYLLTNDQSGTVAGDNSVITHTIGFNFSESWLETISQAGGGLHFNADSADSLLAAFDEILGNVNGTFAAPSVNVNAFKESRHRDELYYTFFQPKPTTRWDGNVKKYRLVDGVIVDQNGDALVDANGVIDEDSQSLWALAADGERVKDGGLAALQPLNRNWYTDTGAADVNNDITAIIVDENDDVSEAWVGAGSEAERNDIVAFARGRDVLDQDGNNGTNEPNRYVADSLHNSPLLLSYWAKAATDTTTEFLNEVIFSANNMGVLHAVDASTGQEKWSYTPQELLPNIKQYMDDELGDHVYGLDGNMVLHTTHKTTTNYDYEVDSAWLYLTQRRGGRSIYALDVSNGHSTTDPFEVMWKIDGDTDNEFRNLGQTWATPQVIPIKHGCPDNCQVKEVLMFGGGYSPLYDDKSLSYPVTAAATGHGNAVYFVDLETGELIWSAGNGAHHSLNLPINDSIPETPVPVDTDADGIVDILFFSDIAGHVWRVDLDRFAGDTDDLAISGGMIASLAPVIGNVKQPLRFFNRIDVVINGTTYSTASFNLVLGSGMRSSPLYVEPVLNRLYSFRDSWVFTNPIGDELDADGNPVPEYRYVKDEDTNTRDVITSASLFEYVEPTDSSSENAVSGDYFGFYKILSARAEKILQSTLTHAGRVFLISYVPPDPAVSSGGCNYQLGESRLQILDLQYGTDLVPIAFRPYVRVGSGIVANGTIVDTGSENGPDFLMGINSEKLVDLLEPDNPNIFRRFFRTGWSELDE